ncbi:unnamed protein product [Paramecium primaurelia]|uniref:Uncharacterized protein n=1 Tax=Paramecium primaurelia TaxID=5886 RepID=A0A8S1JLP0_PARPR|nr:unnamed protein product [Paramecium primaurelia]
MNFKYEAFSTVDTIFKHIQESQNERIIKALDGMKENILKKLEELDQQEEDLKIKEVFLQKLQKLQQFTDNPGNLKQVWKYVSFKIYQQQDQFMELIKNVPNIIEYQLKQKVLTLSTFIKQSCAELYSHQLVTFQIKLQLDESLQKENIEEEDCVGCVTYVSPEVQNQRLFKIEMKLKGFTSKVKKLEDLINNGNLESDLLKFTFDNKSQKITLWSTDDQLSYQITNKPTLDEQPIFEQRIYLQTGMVIQLTKTFQIIVNGTGNVNNKEKIVNEHFTPFQFREDKNQIKPVLLIEKQMWISLNNGFENVFYYPNENPIKLSQYQTLPRGFEVLLQNDGCGHYITVIGNCQKFAPRILSKKKSIEEKDTLLQFNTSQENFNLGIIYQDNIRLLLNSDLLPIWNGTEIFDL